MDKWQEDDNIEIKDDGSIIRGVERVATTGKGHVETYRRWNHITGTTYGARLVNPNTGETEIETENHEDKEKAGKWLMLALGFLGVALLLLGFG